jgi:hypothetical protein
MRALRDEIEKLDGANGRWNGGLMRRQKWEMLRI